MTAIGKDAGGWTPGPWVRQGSEIVSANDPICSLPALYRGSREAKAALDADAHLIAAAPELYTKLEEWAGLVESGQVGGIGVHAFAQETRKLLAKARGERA